MKNILLFMLLLLTIISCKKDPCDDVACLNGGICNDGTCQCPSGYSGPQCENFNPCANITCYNGGTCANGQCNCPTGYSGSDCSTALTPMGVRINSIHLTSYPMTTSSGGGWDAFAGNGPDVFTTLNLGTTSNQNSYVSGTIDNVTGQSLVFSSGLPVTLTSIYSNYSLGVWDEDTGTTEFMAGVYFMPGAFTSGFPGTITLSVGSVYATLYVTWLF